MATVGVGALPASFTEPGGDRHLNGDVVNSRGRGMYLLGFVPVDGGLKTQPLGAPEPVTNSSGKSKRDKKSKLEAEEAGAAAEEAGAAVSSVVRGPAQWKRGRPVYEVGNYRNYYGYRYEEIDEDQRLGALAARLGDDLFRGLEVLDIGCNSGAVSLAVAQCYRARRVVGVDIDEGLVDAARQAAAEVKRGKRTEFRAEDILSSPLKRPPSMEPERFDVILCFSITKWVHFAHGDTGIRNLFKRCMKRLRPGGLFILEPQDWLSYKKKRHLTPEIRQNVASIEMRPEAFGDYLSSLGFVPAGTVECPESKPTGFSRRPILLFRRPAAAAAEGEGHGDTEDVPQDHQPNGNKVKEEEEDAPNKKKRRRDAAEESLQDPPKLSKQQKNGADEDDHALKPPKKRKGADDEQ